MLDDFKTELKRLGDENLERELARQPMSPPPPVIEKPQDDGIKVEDVTTPSERPTRLSLADSVQKNHGNPGIGGRCSKRCTAGEVVGRAGTKITQLPSLGQCRILAS
jgi:hypothetical protein